MDYSKMSDQEINMVVASIIYPDRVVIESKSRPPSASITSHHPSKWVDYCNNPADAWPIILKHRISIVFDSSDEGDEAAEWVTACVGNEEHFSGYHSCDKALRAAMIVFLMMQESANVQDNPT